MPDPAGASPAAVYSFDRVAEEYEVTRYLPPVIAERTADLLTGGLAKSDWFLDAGVGTGRIGRALAARHPRTVGVDISPAMLRRFQAAFPAGRGGFPPDLLLADLRALPFPDASFSGALTVHVLHLIAGWRQALAELWRTLRPGGTLSVGYEDRSRSAVRSHFLTLAGERGLLDDAPRGAHSSEAAALLREWTPDAAERRLPALAWSHRATAAETLDLLARRTYSSLWTIPDDAIAALTAETETWAKAHFGVSDLGDVTEVFDSQLVLFTARKPAH